MIHNLAEKRISFEWAPQEWRVEHNLYNNSNLFNKLDDFDKRLRTGSLTLWQHF